MNDHHLPELSEQTLKWIQIYLPSVYAAGVALTISALNDIRAGKPWLYTVTGALICGLFALSLSAMLEYFGLPANGGAFVGGLVGFVGADRLRDIALALVYRRAGVSEKKEKDDSNSNWPRPD
ncbi:phage holin, lambda family [Pantoea agglomerans]|uniref:phage holin, lambda family n=1 Tax=Enterobacter agglomerans TaxID=549 RepID=UPI0013B60B2C|nr:phage holin, lambda family [Pantoea agglomerans]NEG58204.1 phage holin, lambda family [Pantoea agglomerans]NEG99917.1 phage holin, lambda family [Pantoea agglomerans]NEH04120.1 phage holin, lambda family [Pantoea agglomerans]NEH14477.1 phage holin, lambda family [Pantoea agglomerans]